MEKVSFSDIKIIDGFWKNRQDINRKTTIYAVRDRFLETGRFDAFNFDWKEGVKNKPHIFWESDIAKWIESVSYLLEDESIPELEVLVEEIIDKIEKNQCADGYFNIFFTVCEPENRFKKRTEHELYCAGHLMEAAVAYYNATRKDRFLKLICKYADYIEKVFKLEESADFVTGGHEEIELALVKLFYATGERRYLELSKFFIDRRGNNQKDNGLLYGFVNEKYDQSHLPVREQFTAEGHSVRACYLYSAMADIAYEYNDKELYDACKQLFLDIINKKMYITGGVGQSFIGEAFTVPYDLPNRKAYSETCAAIALAFFANRMNNIHIDSIYSDTIEKLIYNGIISGISIDGKSFFYENPLEIYPQFNNKDVSVLENHREHFCTKRLKVFNCSCCPPNITRFLAALGDCIYSKYSEGNYDTFYIHQYISSEYKKGDIILKQLTGYPKNGKITIKTQNVKKLAIRVPDWCDNYTISNKYVINNGYAYINNPSSEIEVDFEMIPVLMQSSPLVAENAGKAALQYGPLIYCIEEIDNSSVFYGLKLDPNTGFEVDFDEYFNANIITADGLKPVASGKLYEKYNIKYEKTKLKFIPYFGIANRGECGMKVWLLC